MKRSVIFFVALLLFTPFTGQAQKGHCKFLNEECDKPIKQTRPSTIRPQLSDVEHLQRCLTDYVRRNGQFVPEGHSTRQLKSRSDMTAMCQFAIARKNYYWDLPTNP